MSDALGARVLMVSKPVAPPWNDSSKNLVRDLARSLRRHRATVMTRDGVDPELPGVDRTALYGSHAGHFAPALAANARVLWALMTGARYDLWHFFFAPNPRSSAACAWAARRRGMRTIQTVCSAPAGTTNLVQVLFADRIVVLSHDTERRVLAAGIAPERVRHIPPAVEPLAVPTAAELRQARDAFALPQDRALVLYPGDLEFSSGAECMIRAHAAMRERRAVTLVLACRVKTAKAKEHELRLRGLVAELGLQDSTLWLGETPHIHRLLAAADVVALPADTLYAKMDLPLVLIEAMLLERAVVTSDTIAAAELAQDDAAVAVTPTPGAVARAIQALLEDPEARRALGQRARAAALERYHPTRMASAYETVYDELHR